MITIKSKKEIEIMRKAGQIMKQVHKEVESKIRPGISTYDLDKIIEKIIIDNNAISAEKGYPNFKPGGIPFPGNSCISVNDVVVHGVPKKNQILQNGDIVSIDLVIKYKGMHVDAARTYIIGKTKDKRDEELVIVTEDAFFEAMKYAKPGYRIGDISYAIEKYVKNHGFDVIREYQGHGIGKKMHEGPAIPNYGKPGLGPRIEPGMTLAIEPMVVAGSKYITDDHEDGWTVTTIDGKNSAHYENTVLITTSEPEILTL